MHYLQTWREYAQRLKAEGYAVYLACRDPRTPWYAKALAACVAGYAFSPIDLIPDFIPVLGYLDDLVIVPLGIALVLKMIPAEVMVECRKAAEERLVNGKPRSWVAGVVILLIWAVVIGAIGVWVVQHVRR